MISDSLTRQKSWHCTIICIKFQIWKRFMDTLQGPTSCVDIKGNDQKQVGQEKQDVKKTENSEVFQIHSLTNSYHSPSPSYSNKSLMRDYERIFGENPEEKILSSQRNEIMLVRINQQEPITQKYYHKNQVKNFMRAALKCINLNDILDIQDIQEYLHYIQSKMDSRSINDLKEFWTNQKYGISNRKLFENFLRKKSFHWIFTSKQIKNKIKHLRWRAILLKKIKDPYNLQDWKDN